MKKLLIACLLSAGFAQAADWGRLPPAPLPEPGAAGPAHHSRVFVAETVINNGRAVLDIPLDAAEDAYLVVFEERPVTARAPEGRELPHQPFQNPVLASMDVPSVGARIDLATLGRGAHRVNLETARGSGPLKYAVLQPGSPLEMTIQLAPLAARAGEPVTVTARLPDTLPADTRVIARVRGAGRIELRDDGRNGDATADDGIYSGAFTAPRGKGLREAVVRVDADGKRHNGTRFRRTATATAMVSHGGARIDGVVDTEANALGVPLAGKGRYRVEAIYGAGGETLAWVREEWNGGKRIVELPRPEISAAADRAVIRVLDLDTLALADETAIDLEPLNDAAVQSAASAPRLPASKAEAARRHGLER